MFKYGGTFLDNNIKLIDVINYGTELIIIFTDHYQYYNIGSLHNLKIELNKSPVVLYGLHNF